MPERLNKNHYEDVIYHKHCTISMDILPHPFTLNIDKNVSIRGLGLKIFIFCMALCMVCIYIPSSGIALMFQCAQICAAMPIGF